MPTLKYVPEHNGIEIYFNTKPDASVCEELKENGWRWHRVKYCWFAKNNSRNEKFAKTLCNEQSHLEIPESNNIPSTDDEIASFSYVFSDQTIFSTVTITRKQKQYSISSTNNQITCCDCNRWMSIHAATCPGCGCPQNYIINYYFNKYQTQTAIKLKEKEEQQRAMEHRKKQLIERIHDLFHYDLRQDLWQKSLDDVQIAYNRADYLNSHKGELSYIFRDDFLSLLTSSESSYQQQLIKLRQTKQREEFDYQKKKQEEAESNFRKYDKLRYYQKYYPEYGLSPQTHLHLSEDQIRELIKKQSGNL